MKTQRLGLLGVALCFVAVSFAQVPADAPAGTTGLCKDGTYSQAANKRGACSGHQGVQTWYASAPTAAPPPPAAKPASASSSTTSTSPPANAAPGGGPGLVWLNSSSNVYHCQGDRWYGKTKHGEYMSEAEAKAKNARPDHGKPCQS
jgi:uncharacterized protein DUF3761